MSTSEFQAALRIYRNQQNRQRLVDLNIDEATDILQRLDDLYGITDHDADLATYTTIISTTTHSFHHRYKRDDEGNPLPEGEFNYKKWSFFPSRPTWFHIEENVRNFETTRAAEYRRHLTRKVRSVARSFAGRDPMFAIGYSKIHCLSSRSFQFEVDFEYRISEVNLEQVLNRDLLNRISQVIRPHIIFSGNRSVYVAFFTQEPLSRSVWLEFYEAIRRHLIFNGKNDVHTFYGAGLRLPLSRHQSSHGLCRFLDCHTEHEVVDYLSTIIPDNVNGEDLKVLIADIAEYQVSTLKYRGSCIHQSLSIRERNKIKRLMGDSDIPLKEFWKHLNLLDTSEDSIVQDHEEYMERMSESLIDAGLDSDAEDRFSFASQYNPILLHSSSFSLSSLSSFIVRSPFSAEYCLRSPNIAVYEKMIVDGIPYGASTEILVHSDFVRYCFNGYKSIGEDPIENLRAIIVKGCTDESTIRNRLSKLFTMIELVQHDLRIQRRRTGSSPSEMVLTDEMIETVCTFRRELETQDRRMNREKYVEALQWLFRMFLYYGNECHIGVADAEESLNLSGRKMASKILNYFQHQFPIMRIKTPYWYDKSGGKGWKQELELLPPDEWATKIDKKNKKLTRREKDAQMRKYKKSGSLEEELFSETVGVNISGPSEVEG